MDSFLNRRFGFDRLDAPTWAAIQAARHRCNRGPLRLVAWAGTGTGLVFGVGVLTGLLVPFTHPQWSLYLGAFGFFLLVFGGFSVRWALDRNRGGYRIFISLALTSVVLLNFLGRYAVGDRSIYLLGLMATALVLSAPLEWYLIVFSLAWVVSLAGLMVWFPPQARPGNAVVLGAMTLMSLATAQAIEVYRMRNTILTFQLQRKNEELRDDALRDPVGDGVLVESSRILSSRLRAGGSRSPSAPASPFGCPPSPRARPWNGPTTSSTGPRPRGRNRIES